jgi:4a-hydroxytetrahydrobiopterin dehydratase
MTDLVTRHCKPCDFATPPVDHTAVAAYLQTLDGWELEDGKLVWNTKCTNFRAAAHFVSRVADLAESEGHHPDILLHGWNRVRLTLYTHAIDALSENDFILAAKIDQLLASG